MENKKRMFLCRTNSAHVHGIMINNYYEKFFVELNIFKVLLELAIVEGSAAYYSQNRKRLQNFRRHCSLYNNHTSL
jgi:hypothetical protein